MRLSPFVLLAAAALGSAASAEPTKLLRFPDVHGDAVVFCYAGDLWRAPIRGGTAVRLTAHPGVEVFPKFSPDGKWIAFTGQYEGDEQVYVMPSEGGVPKRLTYYPAEGPLAPRWGYDNIVYGWTPDGSKVLFRSQRYGYASRPGQLYTVSRDGGPAEPLPMPQAGAGDFSPDGKRLVYSPLWRDFRSWKRYEGGWAQDLYLYDLQTNGVKKIAGSPRTERDPMWIGNAIYFVSDRDGTLNLYRYDLASEEVKELTDSKKWDVRWASSDGKKTIVYEQAGGLVVFDVASGVSTPIDITVPDDGLWDRPGRVDAQKEIEDWDLSPKGERALFAARGDIFTAPIEHGPTRNLTRTSGAHDRAPVWSPDGKTIVFISDLTGEEEIYSVAQDGSSAPKALTKGNAQRLYRPVISPDGKRVAYADKEGRIYVVGVEDGKQVQVADEHNFQSTDYAWSPDSAWLAFSLSEPNGARALWIWGVADGKARKVTDGFFGEYQPSWDPDGRWLWYLSEREYAPQISSVEWNFATDRMTGIFALALRKDVADPFAPLSDEVKPASDEKKDKDKKEEKPKPVAIDFEGLGGRVSRVPIEADDLSGLQATATHLYYTVTGAPYYGRSSYRKPELRVYDLEKRKESTPLEDVRGWTLSSDGKKVLARGEGGFSLYDAPDLKKDSKKSVSTAGLVVDRVPREEWAEVFREVWRRYRDYFYVENMHGYDWKALREQYEPLVRFVGHRSDLNYVISEMIAELNIGHAYIAGGDFTIPERAPVGLLGAKLSWDAKAGRYRFAKIWDGENEEPRYRSPLRGIGVDVREGDFLVAIDGDELRGDEDPFRLLVNRAANPVTLTVAPAADPAKTRDVKVVPTRDEGPLIYLDWVERNRRFVAEKTGSRVGYIHVPDMGASGAREFVKWFYPQARLEGLVVDDRANGGGNISQWIIERLRRELLGIRFARTSDQVRTYPEVVMRGPMACLVSETSASDGDIFPYMFRTAGLGPLIGKRTWGGVTGITNHGPLIDGGSVNVPQFSTLSKDGRYVIEGEGVTPDIEVENDPASEIAGRDPQLERGVKEVLDRLEKHPVAFPPQPPDPVKTR